MTVRYERRGYVAVLTLSDVSRRNALSRAIVRSMLESLLRAAAEHARAIVIAGDGTAFCSGANMADLRDGWMEGNEPETDPVRLFRALVESPIPLVAAVHGAALGGGFELTLSCDFVVAGEQAWFALPELGVGVVPNTALARLPQLVGVRRATEIILLRERLSATQALSLGLATKVVPTGSELDEALAMARRIVSTTTPGALAAAKRHLLLHNAIDWERVRSSLHEVPKPEWQEGLDAYTEHRPFDYDKFWPDAGAK
jgi:enoyl-CoA hydratase/carnithine racemase